jgi:hypothetical protein
MATTISRPRVASPARWRSALSRAIAENVQVRQLAGCGAWIATSGSDATVAYEVEVTGDVAHGCTCLAGINGDPVCKHRAAFYLAAGLLDPEPVPPAAMIAETARCRTCLGDGYIKIMTGGRLSDWIPGSCHRCKNTGQVPVQLTAADAGLPFVEVV